MSLAASNSALASTASPAEAWRLQAEVDALLDRLAAWNGEAPDWPPAASCRAILARLRQRVEALRVRVEAPLVVALLGGTGAGKSTLVNALLGQDVAVAGRQRPTTLRPLVVCRPGLAATDLGLDSSAIDVMHVDRPLLRHVVLVDCPDPDTTESDAERDTNLARLRAILPNCDVLLVTATQQKYRSARVLDELAAAAPGARLVFVQTHAEQEDDIRQDWRRVLVDRYEPGEMFLVDSLAALEAQRSGAELPPDFARLVDLLTKQLSGAAGNRIRWANFLDLVDQALSACHARIEEKLPAVEQAAEAVREQRVRLWERLASSFREELLDSRRQWDLRLLTELTARWGMSPFTLAIRLYLALGNLLSGGLLLKVRTPAQLALWGAWEGARRWQRQRDSQQADRAAALALTGGWDDAELRTATIIVDGYAHDAQLPRPTLEDTTREAAATGAEFVARASVQLGVVVRRAAARPALTAARAVYEVLWTALLVMLAVRWGKNFFYDSWLAQPPQPILGFDFYLGALVSGLLWGGLLIALFTWQARRGQLTELNALFGQWTVATESGGLFRQLDRLIEDIRRYAAAGGQLRQTLAALRREVALPESELGRPRLP